MTALDKDPISRRKGEEYSEADSEVGIGRSGDIKDGSRREEGINGEKGVVASMIREASVPMDTGEIPIVPSERVADGIEQALASDAPVDLNVIAEGMKQEGVSPAEAKNLLDRVLNAARKNREN